MKKILTSVSFLLLLQTIASAQSPASHLSITGGASLPTGSFSSTELYDGPAGFAKTGWTGRIQYTHSISRSWSWVAAFQIRQHGIDTRNYQTTYGSAYFAPIYSTSPSPTPPTQDAIRFPNWTFTKSTWLDISLTGGVEYHKPLNPRGTTEYFVRLSAGPVMARSPHLEGQSTTDTSAAALDKKSRTGWGVMLLAESGLYFKLSKRISLSTAVSFTGTNELRFSKTVTRMGTARGQIGFPGYTVSQSSMTRTEKQAMNSVSLQAGIRWQMR